MSGADGGGRARSFSFASGRRTSALKRLFTVNFTHSYYTQNDLRCTDFAVVPTDTTSQLMASLGLAFKAEASGFAVFYRPEKLPGLIEYLKQNAQDPAVPSGFWSRMTFLLMLTNPQFVGVTALPIETKLSQVNLFGCNLYAHRRGNRAKVAAQGEALLTPGNYMGAEALLPVVGASVNLAVPAQAQRIIVTDISGAIVIPAPGSNDVPISGGSSPGDAKRATLDFSSLAYDVYTVSVEDKGGKPIDALGYPRELLYLPGDGESMVLLDFLFTQPTLKCGGLYPIPPLFQSDPQPDECGDVAYQLAFEARRTYWQYFVVPEIPGSQLRDLEITGPGAGFAADPQPVPLPDGSLATLFTADTPLALSQKSDQHFHLKGIRHDASGNKNRIALTRLPVAPAAPVWPGPASESTTGRSEMFLYV